MGIAVRVMDLTDEPLDFQPARQLRSALLARAIYFQVLPGADPAVAQLAKEMAAAVVPQEPPVLETVVAMGYIVAGGEHLWIVRIIHGVLWAVAGWAVYDLVRRWTSASAGWVSLAYFLLLPFGVYVTRSFQPDALGVVCLVGAVYGAVRWNERPSWKWVILVAVAAGLCLLEKLRLAPILGGALAGCVLTRNSWRTLLLPQVWTMAALALLPAAAYYGGFLREETSGWASEYSFRLLSMSADPSFYGRWLVGTDSLFSTLLLFLGFLGTFLLPPTGRNLTLGMWLGFLVYAVLLPFFVLTHNYYNLPLVLPISFGLAPLGERILSAFNGVGRTRWVALVLAVGAILYPVWRIRATLIGSDFRGERGGWERVGRDLPTDGPILGLTHDYGHRLAYYGWRRVDLWPSRADEEYRELLGSNEDPDFRATFERRTNGYRYFLITNFAEWEAQQELFHWLRAFPVAVEGSGYIVFDLGGS